MTVRSRRPRPVAARANGKNPPPEAGATETEQLTQILPSDVDVVPPEGPAQKPVYAVLTGPELQEVRRRNDLTDWLRDRSKDALKEAENFGRSADINQAGLTQFISMLRDKYDLDPNFNYTVDLERGMFVPQQTPPQQG